MYTIEDFENYCLCKRTKLWDFIDILTHNPSRRWFSFFTKTTNRLLYTMGGTFSEPIPNVGDVGYVAIVVLQNDKLRLLHCPPNVREMVHNTIR